MFAIKRTYTVKTVVKRNLKKNSLLCHLLLAHEIGNKAIFFGLMGKAVVQRSVD
jgi:hypothetical protein